MAERTEGFGGKLRAARERRGVSLRDIANRTKISVGVLEALERNDFSRLPGGIFGRAFVRSYATEVGLDPDETLQEFLGQLPHDASVAAGHARVDELEDGEALDSERRTATTFLRLIGVSVPLIGVLLYFSSGVRRDTAPPEAPGPPEPASAAPIPPAPVPAPAVDTRPAAVTNPTALTSSAPPPAATAGAEGRLTVDLSATRPCWIEATVDGTRVIEQLLQPGDARTLQVRREMVLKAGDAGAVTVKLNGAPARVFGKDGEVVTARLNLSNYREYLAPR